MKKLLFVLTSLLCFQGLEAQVPKKNYCRTFYQYALFGLRLFAIQDSTIISLILIILFIYLFIQALHIADAYCINKIKNPSDARKNYYVVQSTPRFSYQWI